MLLILDEIAVGFGRTGKMFASDMAGISPDILVMGKSLTGGYLPMSAAGVTEEIFQSFRSSGGVDRTFYHGHTFSGNPLACAAALGAVRVFRRKGYPPREKRWKMGSEALEGSPGCTAPGHWGGWAGWKSRNGPVEPVPQRRLLKSPLKKGSLYGPRLRSLPLAPPGHLRGRT